MKNTNKPDVGQIWLNEKEKQTKVLLAVCPPTKKEKCFVAFQVLETGCVYNEYFDEKEHIFIGISSCDLSKLFEVIK